jgi:hypothetical protein
MNRTALYVTVVIASLTFFSGTVLAGNFATGASRTSDVLLDVADNWTTILSASITISEADDRSHGCVVNASADVGVPVAPERLENHYRFTVTWNDANPPTNGTPERTLEFYNHPNFNDLNSQPVATTRAFLGLTRSNGTGLTQNQHTFRVLGRKVQEGDSTATVFDASLSVICIERN